MSVKKKVCLVSEELAGFAGSGGIGAAMEELAACLAENNYMVDFLYAPISSPDQEEKNKIYQRMYEHGVKVIFLEGDKYAWGGDTIEKKSYSIYMYLRNSDVLYDVLHFHDYKGLGFCTINAKKQGLDFQDTHMAVQIHGPLRWTVDVNQSLFTHPEQLRIDFMEKKCIEHADSIICPSLYILSWLKSNNFTIPSSPNVHVIKNLYRLAASGRSSTGTGNYTNNINEIILFARHEDRKGFTYFCDAVDKISDTLSEKKIKISFLGKLGLINGRMSGAIITTKAMKWRFPVEIKCNLNRYEAISVLKNKNNAAIFIPSPFENLPYTVLEAISLNKPVVTSRDGGAKELMCSQCHDELTIKIDADNIAKKILDAIEIGLPNARPSETIEEIESKWINFHEKISNKNQTVADGFKSHPKVVFGITHFERPGKLVDAVITGIKQTYQNLEIVVVDDGSQKSQTVEALINIEAILKRCGGRLIRRENGYLGAARNTIANNVDCDYIIFLDDDDLAFPNMVDTLVTAAIKTDADIVGCFNLFLDESNREKALANPEKFQQKLSYAPLGGPLSISTFENWLGASTSLIKLASLKKIGGYTELRNVGFEDYEFYIRALQNGLKIEMVPRPLYLYEVGRPSMLSNTPTIRNYRRIIDALDLHDNQDTWLDLINLNTGMKASNEQVDKLNWEYNNRDKSNADIWRMDCSKDEYVERLAQYAESFGNLALASSWRNSLSHEFQTYNYNSHKDSEVYSITEHGFLLKISDRNKDEDLFGKIESSGMLLDIKLGRYHDVIQRIISISTAQNAIDRNLSDVIRYLSISINPDGISTELDHLIEKIINTKAKSIIRNDVSVSLALLAMKNGRRDLFESLVLYMFDADEAEYFSHYPEVEDAVKSRKILVSGLQHFKRHGFLEQRIGFSRMTDLSKSIGKILDRTLYPWNIGDVCEIEIIANASQD